ncbi:hypothetical protein Patl1_05914 [Pistacia atlantica]|uniref:Uncharacterized protein n=1 Tax=Pistacia atlantica TaxID=434234 RepID=A0ACC1BRH2_9ROSI|nr:hypothetical protein Patl1_05914 [Pistacia atlantica]
MPDFSESVVKQVVINLKRIHSLGVRKVVVLGLEPVGCLPAIYETSDQTCSKTFNDLSKYHNSILKQAVNKLSNEISCPHKSVFRILDLYKAFMSAFKQKHQDCVGRSKFEKPFESCCVGLNGYSCGDVDEKGVKQYSVCENPESSFFWDLLHPTQSGWLAVYSVLKLHFIHYSSRCFEAAVLRLQLSL